MQFIKINDMIKWRDSIIKVINSEIDEIKKFVNKDSDKGDKGDKGDDGVQGVQGEKGEQADIEQTETLKLRVDKLEIKLNRIYELWNSDLFATHIVDDEIY